MTRINLIIAAPVVNPATVLNHAIYGIGPHGEWVSAYRDCRECVAAILHDDDPVVAQCAEIGAVEDA